MKYKNIKKRIQKIAQKIAKDFSEFNTLDVAEAENIITKFVEEINEVIDRFKNKQIPALNRLQNKMDAVKRDLVSGEIEMEEAEERRKNILEKMKTKQFYLDEDTPEAKNFKNYTSENERYIDGILREGGALDAFECIAKVISRNHSLVEDLASFQEHYTNKFGNGTYLRTILGKQSSNRQLAKTFMSCAKTHKRTKALINELSDITRNVMVDLVDTHGRIVAHTSVTSAALRDFEQAHKNLDKVQILEDNIDVTHPGYHRNIPTVSSVNRNAGVLDNIFGFFRGLLNNLKKVTTDTIKSVQRFFGVAESAEKQTKNTCGNILSDIESFIKAFELLEK